uniref:Bacterial surface antigen (D15) domain-containing protein n=1 Tax=Quercus lobata TaxID=97700 RepID=A0A7N2KMY9_QUELO
MLEGAIFLDCGTDLGSGIHVPVWTEAVVRLMAESIKTRFGGSAKLNREVLQLGRWWLQKIRSKVIWIFGVGLSMGSEFGNPALRQGKPGCGVGLGYGLRFKSQFGHFQVDYAINAFQQKTVYFGISNLAS